MRKIMKIMNNISRSQSVYRAEKCTDKNINSGHHAFVLTICHFPGRSQEEIARELCLNKSTVARVITQLENRGYIIRKTNRVDKRQTLVYPSEKMLEIYPKIKEISASWSSYMTDGIGDDDMEIFYSVLLKIEKRAKEAIKEIEEGER